MNSFSRHKPCYLYDQFVGLMYNQRHKMTLGPTLQQDALHALVGQESVKSSRMCGTIVLQCSMTTGLHFVCF
jgi:hypothetical protein